jgi:hypothetical protein
MLMQLIIDVLFWGKMQNRLHEKLTPAVFELMAELMIEKLGNAPHV